MTAKVRTKFCVSGSKPYVLAREAIDKVLDPTGWEQKKKAVAKAANVERACQDVLLRQYLDETGLAPSDVELCVESTVHQSKYWFQPKSAEPVSTEELVAKALRKLDKHHQANN